MGFQSVATLLKYCMNGMLVDLTIGGYIGIRKIEFYDH